MNNKRLISVNSYRFPFDPAIIKEVPAPFPLQRAFRVQKHPLRGLLVIATIAEEEDGFFWLHVSFSRKKTLPDYNDVTFVKKQFIGDDLKAIMVFPRAEEHFNLYENCLHLWANLRGDYLPDFRTQGHI